MKAVPSDRTGVLILRLWMEPNHETPLRARIIERIDTKPAQSVAVAASADEICESIKSWVETFADQPTPDWNGETTPGMNGRDS